MASVDTNPTASTGHAGTGAGAGAGAGAGGSAVPQPATDRAAPSTSDLGPDHLCKAANHAAQDASRRHRSSMGVRTGNQSVTAWLKKQYDSDAAKLRAASVRVFYAQEHINASVIQRLITEVPMVAVSGDSSITLQNGSSPGNVRPVPGLLSYEERRVSRKKVIASLGKILVSGGYHAPMHTFKTPRDCVLLTTAGSQFEMLHLEAQDVIVLPNELTTRKPDAPLFPAFYKAHNNGVKPTLDDLAGPLGNATMSLDDGGVLIPLRTRRQTWALDRAACLTSMVEDGHLIMTAFNTLVKTHGSGKRGWLKATAVGMGFFAQLASVGNISHLLFPLLLEAWRLVLTRGSWPHVAVVEFPDFARGSYTPKWGDTPVNGVRIVKGSENRRDVLLWTPAEAAAHVCGVLNAGDCYCIPGNEFGYCSVEAMIGNNTDLRVVQSYLHNPYILDACRHVPVSVAHAPSWVAAGLRLPAALKTQHSNAAASDGASTTSGATAAPTAAVTAARDTESRQAARMATARELAHAAAAAHAAGAAAHE